MCIYAMKNGRQKRRNNFDGKDVCYLVTVDIQINVSRTRNDKVQKFKTILLTFLKTGNKKKQEFHKRSRPGSLEKDTMI